MGAFKEIDIENKEKDVLADLTLLSRQMSFFERSTADMVLHAEQSWVGAKNPRQVPIYFFHYVPGAVFGRRINNEPANRIEEFKRKHSA